MSHFSVPTRDQVSPANQTLFDHLAKGLGMVPNLYATFALSEHALGSYLAFQGAKSSIQGKAREVVNLVVSQVNGCAYCLAAHTVVGGMVGFTPEQILEIRAGRASFDSKLDALARLVRNLASQRGHADPLLLQAFFDAGWTQENLVDAIVVIGDKTIANYLHSTTQVPVDFPLAPELAARCRPVPVALADLGPGDAAGRHAVRAADVRGSAVRAAQPQCRAALHGDEPDGHGARRLGAGRGAQPSPARRHRRRATWPGAAVRRGSGQLHTPRGAGRCHVPGRRHLLGRFLHRAAQAPSRPLAGDGRRVGLGPADLCTGLPGRGRRFTPVGRDAPGVVDRGAGAGRHCRCRHAVHLRQDGVPARRRARRGLSGPRPRACGVDGVARPRAPAVAAGGGRAADRHPRSGGRGHRRGPAPTGHHRTAG